MDQYFSPLANKASGLTQLAINLIKDPQADYYHIIIGTNRIATYQNHTEAHTALQAMLIYQNHINHVQASTEPHTQQQPQTKLAI